MAKNSGTTTIQVPKDVHTKLKVKSAQDGVTLAHLVASLLRKLLGMG